MKNQPPGHTGRHFLQIPGPTNVPDRVLHAIAFPTIDHRGPEFANLGKEITQPLDSWLEENTAAMLARWLMEQRERPATREQSEPAIAATSNGDRSPAPDNRSKTAQVVSDNFFADQTGSPPDFRSRP